MGRAAVDKAKAEFKLLVVYLHSPHHEDTHLFCRETLFTQPLKVIFDPDPRFDL